MTEPIKFENVEISVFQGKGMNGGPSRRLFTTIEDINTIPAELFAIKISQSKKPELSGKPVFKYFSYRTKEDQPFSIKAPESFNLSTPVEDIKDQAVKTFSAMKAADPKGVSFSVVVNLNGSFTNIDTPEGSYTVFDDKQFPDTEGRPGYYIKRGTKANVELEQATSQYGKYYRVSLSSNEGPDAIFQRAGHSKVWGQEDDGASTGFDNAPATDENDGNVW